MVTSLIVMLIVGAVLGLVLAVASKVFYVEVDEREAEVTSMLPGYNCGGCGFPGCSGMAAALVSGKSTKLLCKPCKKEQAEVIQKYLAEKPGPDGKTVNITI